jgi:thiol-disulfide isomerase/thioredoxin
MKKICLSLLIISIFFSGCKSTKHLADQKSKQSTHAVSPDVAPAPVNFSDQTTWILGYFDPDRLTHYPYSTWYTKGFDEYMPKSEGINKLLDISKDKLTIKVVMGIWCPDSRREVPRFMKVLNEWQFPSDKITFIGVDNEKKSPVGEYVGLGIVRVPTFIVYKNNVEAGRIIENPVASLEQDLVNILTGMNNNK